VSADVIDRLRAAAESVDVEAPAPHGALRAGRRRSIRRGVALLTAIGVVGAGTTWAVTQLDRLNRPRKAPIEQPSFDSHDTHPIALPYGGTIPLPTGWFERGEQIPDNIGLVLSTSRTAVEGARNGCAPTIDQCVTGLVDAGQMGRDDAFLQVAIIDLPCDGCLPSPLPQVLGPADFHAAGSTEGKPVMVVQRWVEAARQINVGYWVGPDASDETNGAIAALIANLNLPKRPLDEGAVHLFHVPYSDAWVPIPDSWASTSAQGEHATLGLAASTNRAAVAGLVTGCRPGDRHCAFQRLNEDDLAPTDAFVSVEATFMLCPDFCPPEDPLPGSIDPGAFQRGTFVNGAPEYDLGGRGTDGGRYIIRYWVGPDASQATSDATMYIVSNLHLPNEPQMSGSLPATTPTP
jgi:hypothetical protein